jgi:hypothetical protein
MAGCEGSKTKSCLDNCDTHTDTTHTHKSLRYYFSLSLHNEFAMARLTRDCLIALKKLYNMVLCIWYDITKLIPRGDKP